MPDLVSQFNPKTGELSSLTCSCNRYEHSATATYKVLGDTITPENFSCPAIFHRATNVVFCKNPKIITRYKWRVCPVFLELRDYIRAHKKNINP